ncbi:MAG: STAS domain-containing protein [Clostridia bacterium]|nr:STAS domain-containing protein [Clostridia bacterium]
MTINKKEHGCAVTYIIEGRLDTTTAPELEAVIKSELDGVTDLVFDFSKLDYISSAGLRILLAARKKINPQGSVRVIGANETVREIFELTGFNDILTVE